MVTGDPLIPGAAALAEAKAYLRVNDSEDALIGRLLASGAELCEQFTGQTLIARSFYERIAASQAWTRLSRVPAVAILGVESIWDAGLFTALSADAYAVDIDTNGHGWVRLTRAQPERWIRVRYSAGLAQDWSGLAEPLRQGTVRLAAHLYSDREGSGDAGPPAVVTALWRPYRRMRLG